MPRPRQVLLGVKVPKEVLAALIRQAEAEGLDRSKLARRFIDEGLAREARRSRKAGGPS
jgi:hypothetical protein